MTLPGFAGGECPPSPSRDRDGIGRREMTVTLGKNWDSAGFDSLELIHSEPDLGQGGHRKKRSPCLYPVEWGCVGGIKRACAVNQSPDSNGKKSFHRARLEVTLGALTLVLRKIGGSAKYFALLPPIFRVGYGSYGIQG